MGSAIQPAPTPGPGAETLSTGPSTNVVAARGATQAAATEQADLPTSKSEAEAAAQPGGDLRPFDDFFSIDGTRAQNWRLGIDPGTTTRTADPQAPGAARHQTVAQQLTFAVGNARDGQIEIRLDPAELGRVQIQMHTSEHGVRAVVIAERAETQDLLRRHADALTRDLNEAGFDSVSLDFTAGRDTGAENGERHGSDEFLQGGPTSAAQSAHPVESASAPNPQRRPAAGMASLDIRL